MREGEDEMKGQGRCGGGIHRWAGSVLRLSEKEDFTNEMDYGIGTRTGQKQRASMPMLLKTAIHGGFALDMKSRP